MRLAAVVAALVLAVLGAGSTYAGAKPRTPTGAGSVFQDCAECPPMVVIPAGTGVIGSTAEERARESVPAAFGDREGPQLTVTIAKPFALSRMEVTRGAYARFVAATHRPDTGCGVHNPATDTWEDRAGYNWRQPGFAQTDEHPAVCISWNDAHDFAAWLAKTTGKPYRLPSEAEWEYAARAGTRTARYWGDAVEPACSQANIMTTATLTALGSPKSMMHKLVCIDERSFTTPVGSFPPNAFGLYDMIGNVLEWVADCAFDNHAGAPTDGSARTAPDCTKRFPKGGGFHGPPWLARAASRGVTGPDYHGVAAGIRVARDLD